MPPDAGPRATCSLRRANEGEMCEQSLAQDPYHPFSCKYGGARAKSHRAVMYALNRLISQAGGYADMERQVPELYDLVIPKPGADPVIRCATMGVVSSFPGVLQQLWIDVSAVPARSTSQTTVRRNQVWLRGEGARRRRSDMVLLCARWFLKLVADWAVRAPGCCVTW